MQDITSKQVPGVVIQHVSATEKLYIGSPGTMKRVERIINIMPITLRFTGSGTSGIMKPPQNGGSYCHEQAVTYT